MGVRVLCVIHSQLWIDLHERNSGCAGSCSRSTTDVVLERPSRRHSSRRDLRGRSISRREWWAASSDEMDNNVANSRSPQRSTPFGGAGPPSGNCTSANSSNGTNFVNHGIGTSILVQNGTLSDFLGDSYKVLVKHLKHDSEHSKQSSVDPNLVAQLTRLRQELSSFSSERSSSITVVSAGSSRSYVSLLNVAVPALVIGATGYGYIRLKGLSLGDLMYVTRRSMSNAVSSVSKQLEQVSTALTATKRHLNSRLEHLSGSMDQNKELQADLKNEVSLVREDVEKYGLEIETVQRLVLTLGVKIDSIESKQDVARNGVLNLCNFVEKMQTAESPELIQGVQRPRLEQSPLGSIGLKDLQYISNALESGDANSEISPSTTTEITVSSSQKSVDTATSSNTKGSSPSLQRRFTTSFSAGFTRSFLSRA